MNILSDRHHQDLAYSLVLLFHQRLKHEIYFPIGMEWATEGYWHVYDHPDTQKQYLMDGFIPIDGTPPLNSISRIENGIHVIKDLTHNSEFKSITLEQFKEMDIDIVIASLPQHIKPFKELIRLYQPKAKLIVQIGNMFDAVINNLHEIPNLLASTIEFPVPPSCHAVFYHQEMDLNVFRPFNTVFPKKSVVSFLNLLPQTKWGYHYYEMKQELPEYDFKSYGILADDGIISGVDNISLILNNTMWVWQEKYLGDGFGHNLFSAYACGRPVITRRSDYADKLGGELLEDQVTCIDVEAHPHDLYELVRKLSSETPYTYLSQQAYQRFREKVNYDHEEKKIRKFLEDLQ